MKTQKQHFIKRKIASLILLTQQCKCCRSKQEIFQLKADIHDVSMYECIKYRNMSSRGLISEII